MSKIKLGDFVQSSNHEHEGRVYEIERPDSEWIDWLEGLNIQPTIRQVLGNYIGILCNEHGAVSVPEDTCTVIPPIEGFFRMFNDSPFAEDNTSER